MTEEIDLDSMPTVKIYSIVARGTAILAERAGGAAVVAPVQLELLEPPPPIDVTTVDVTEKLSNGTPRYVRRKAAAGLLGCGIDKVKDLASTGNAGFRLGSTWWIDRTRIPRLTNT